MKTLIVEDDFISRKLLQTILKDISDCDVATDGKEAVNAFNLAHDENKPYDLICLDIMLPKMDGQEVLKQIREIEKTKNIGGLDGVKILMVTALDDKENIMNAFRSGCEAYVVKPIEKKKVLNEIKELGLAI